jgi:hypothetical protein
MNEQDTNEPSKTDGAASELTAGLGDVVILRHSSWWSRSETDKYTVTGVVKDGKFGSGYGIRVTPAVQKDHMDKDSIFYLISPQPQQAHVVSQ